MPIRIGLILSTIIVAASLVWAVAGLVTREGDTVGLALVAPTVVGAIALAVTWAVVLVVGVVVWFTRPAKAGSVPDRH